ncbi:MAG: hypothetical protein L0191_20015, partial [Acidobacteria bacterium]|nr:hypothetical protein [Acidobacteriota bacterium]
EAEMKREEARNLLELRMQEQEARDERQQAFQLQRIAARKRVAGTPTGRGEIRSPFAASLRPRGSISGPGGTATMTPSGIEYAAPGVAQGVLPMGPMGLGGLSPAAAQDEIEVDEQGRRYLRGDLLDVPAYQPPPEEGFLTRAAWSLQSREAQRRHELQRAISGVPAMAPSTPPGSRQAVAVTGQPVQQTPQIMQAPPRPRFVRSSLPDNLDPQTEAQLAYLEARRDEIPDHQYEGLRAMAELGQLDSNQLINQVEDAVKPMARPGRTQRDVERNIATLERAIARQTMLEDPTREVRGKLTAILQREYRTLEEMRSGTNPARGRSISNPAPVPGGKQLTPEIIRQFVEQANGDAALARNLARQAGYTQ